MIYLNDFIIYKPREIKRLQSNIKLANLEYTAKRGWHHSFSKYSLPTVFLRGIRKRYFSLEDVHEQQSQLANESKNMSKGKIPVKKGFV